jgi:enoyl-CoA hydratase
MSVIQHTVDGSVHLLTISRPKAMNALNADVINGLDEAITNMPPDARAVVITGEGKAFVAGADISAMRDLSPLEAEAFAKKGQDLVAKMSAAPFVVIAAVNGFALGGGCELAMGCDIVLAGERAKFGQPEVNLGVIPGFGGTQRLLRRVGMAVALDLCLTGRIISAQEAVDMGLASRVLEGDVVAGAMAVGQEIATKGPIAIHLAKRAIHENAMSGLDSALAAERTLFGLCFATSDQTEGMDAFLNRRKADFTGK